jgi:UDP-N-acetylmuramate dehydrogenase
MLKIHNNYSLKNNTTFGVDIACDYFAEPQSQEDLEYIISHAKKHDWETCVIGEGSNLLFIKNYEGLIIHPLLMGIEKVDESDSEVLVSVGSGENWDSFVAFCVDNNWFGAENLSLIPGSVGASAVQNIGAYGAEAKDIIEYVEYFDRDEMITKIFANLECEFAYRDSIFKHGRKDQYIITKVVFRLRKNGELKLNYGNVREEFLKSPNQDLRALRSTIVSIRESKLPDPKAHGNAGSYFKNPVISQEKFEKLQKIYSSAPNYPAGSSKVKIPAAWLIEQAEWKGVKDKNVGSWPLQPLVIVNYGKATGKEIYDFSEQIRLSIKEKFDIDLEREVTIIG